MKDGYEVKRALSMDGDPMWREMWTRAGTLDRVLLAVSTACALAAFLLACSLPFI